MLFVAEWLDGSTDGGIAKNGIDTAYVPSNFDPIQKLYQSQGNPSKATVIAAINSGKGYINFNGHGNTNLQSVGAGTLFNSDIQSEVLQFSLDARNPQFFESNNKLFFGNREKNIEIRMEGNAIRIH